MNLDYVVMRNIRDFSTSSIPVLMPVTEKMVEIYSGYGNMGRK